MAVYAIHMPAGSETVKQSIRTVVTGENSILEVDDTYWFVVSDCITPGELYQRLAPDNDKGKFIVTSVVAYYGYHDRSVWHWLAAKVV